MHSSINQGKKSFWHKCNFNDMLVAAFLLGSGLLALPNSPESPLRSTHTLTGTTCRQTPRRWAILVDEFLPIDVTQALEEGQWAKCVGVSNLHIARHSLDQSHEALQLRCDVIWGQEMNISTVLKKRGGFHCCYTTPTLALNGNIPMSSSLHVEISLWAVLSTEQINCSAP